MDTDATLVDTAPDEVAVDAAPPIDAPADQVEASPPAEEPAFDPAALVADLDQSQIDALLKDDRIANRIDHRIETARNNAVASQQAKQRRELGTRENVVRAIETVGKELDPNFQIGSLSQEAQNAVWDVIVANQQFEAQDFLNRYSETVRDRYSIPSDKREAALKALESGEETSKDEFFFTLVDGAVEAGVQQRIADTDIEDLLRVAGSDSKLAQSLTKFRSAEAEAATLESKPQMDAPPDVSGTTAGHGKNPVEAITEIPISEWTRMPLDKRQEMRTAADEWARSHPEEAAKLAADAVGS